MTILCANGTHVYLTGHARCTCGAAANGYTPGVEAELLAWDSLSDEALYNLDYYCDMTNQNCPPSSYIFQGYNPFNPHAPAKPTTPDVPLSRLKAAKLARAQHLSADGLRAYRDDRGGVEVAHWDAEAGRFDSWWRCAEIAPDAVAL